MIGAQAAQAAPSVSTPELSALVPLGKHLKVCRLGAGTGMRGGNRQSNHTRMGKEKFEALLNYEYDQGVRLYDAADLYGTHHYLGRVLKSKPRDSFQIVTKIWVRPGGLPEPERPDADVCLKRFLKELDMEYVDVLQIHCMTSPTWTDEVRRQMDIMAKLKKQGLIRAHGVSCHSLAALKLAAVEPWVEVIHARINKFKANMDGEVDDVVEVIKTARRNGKGIIGMKLVGEGKFNAQQRAESVQWVVESGLVDCYCVGFEASEQVDEFKALMSKYLAAERRAGPPLPSSRSLVTGARPPVAV
jgi:aryl-alcohol dehydrogenase-like predicted oxidoreductase